jgi:ribonucleoside-diphosphate reductase alpha chain
VDYCIHLNNYFYKAVQQNKTLKLFSPYYAPDLYEAFYAGRLKRGDTYVDFATVYEEYCETDIPFVEVSALNLMSSIVTERSNTGRLYIMNVDNVNEYTPFNETIHMTNLCVEIAIPTKPIEIESVVRLLPSDKLEYITKSSGEIAVCTLGAINLARIETEEELKNACYLQVDMLDSLLDEQDYDSIYAKESVLKYRPLGIGVIE